MATEQYSIGYEEGRQAGWNAAMESLPAQQQEPTDEQIDAAVKAWFENTIVAGRRPFAKRMRAAIKAANGIKEQP